MVENEGTVKRSEAVTRTPLDVGVVNTAPGGGGHDGAPIKVTGISGSGVVDVGGASSGGASSALSPQQIVAFVSATCAAVFSQHSRFSPTLKPQMINAAIVSLSIGPKLGNASTVSAASSLLENASSEELILLSVQWAGFTVSFVVAKLPDPNAEGGGGDGDDPVSKRHAVGKRLIAGPGVAARPRAEMRRPSGTDGTDGAGPPQARPSQPLTLTLDEATAAAAGALSLFIGSDVVTQAFWSDVWASILDDAIFSGMLVDVDASSPAAQSSVSFDIAVNCGSQSLTGYALKLLSDTSIEDAPYFPPPGPSGEDG